MSKTIAEAEALLLKATRLGSSLPDQAESLGVKDLDQHISANSEMFRRLVGRMQLEYGLRKLLEESGEVAGSLKKHLDHGEKIDETAVRQELGDTLFFVAFIAKCCGISLESIVDAEIESIKKRFGDRWTIEAAARNGKPTEDPRDISSVEKAAEATRSSWQCQAKLSPLYEARMSLDDTAASCRSGFSCRAIYRLSGVELRCCEACARKLYGSGFWSLAEHGRYVLEWEILPSSALYFTQTLNACASLGSLKQEAEEAAAWRDAVFVSAVLDIVKQSSSLLSIGRSLIGGAPRTFARVFEPAILDVLSAVSTAGDPDGFVRFGEHLRSWVAGRSDPRELQLAIRDAFVAADDRYDGHGNYDLESYLRAEFVHTVAVCLWGSTLGTDAKMNVLEESMRGALPRIESVGRKLIVSALEKRLEEIRKA